MANKKKSSSPVKAVPSSGTTNDQPWYMNKKIASWMVFLVAFLVYANTLGHDYTQDDAIVIYDNEFTTQGLSGILGELGDIIPARLRDTAYALAVEVAAVDLHVEQEELRLLKLFRDHFMLDQLTVAAIERGALARYRTMA